MSRPTRGGASRRPAAAPYKRPRSTQSSAAVQGGCDIRGRRVRQRTTTAAPAAATTRADTTACAPVASSGVGSAVRLPLVRHPELRRAGSSSGASSEAQYTDSSLDNSPALPRQPDVLQLQALSPPSQQPSTSSPMVQRVSPSSARRCACVPRGHSRAASVAAATVRGRPFVLCVDADCFFVQVTQLFRRSVCVWLCGCGCVFVMEPTVAATHRWSSSVSRG